MTEKRKFTIEEIRNYIKSQDSLGDVMYFLSEENIIKANQEMMKLIAITRKINYEKRNY